MVYYPKNYLFFDELFRDVERLISGTASVSYESPAFPKADIEVDRETNNVIFHFAVAGYEPEDLEILFEDNSLIVRTIKEYEVPQRDEGKICISSKIKRSKFSERYTIPFDKYDVDNAKARFDNGILSVGIPAKEAAKPKRLEIQKGNVKLLN